MAERIMHDLGAISMMSSDSQAMGRAGEVITRTWQIADEKRQRGKLPEDAAGNDNFRIKRYVAKYTINGAITHGLSHLIGSVEKGKLADLVLWKPAFFGARPEIGIEERLYCLRANWRCQRLNPNAAAFNDAADVRQHRQGRWGQARCFS